MIPKWQYDITLPDGDKITLTQEALSLPFLDMEDLHPTLESSFSKSDRLPLKKLSTTVPISLDSSQGKHWEVSLKRVDMARELV